MSQNDLAINLVLLLASVFLGYLRSIVPMPYSIGTFCGPIY